MSFGDPIWLISAALVLPALVLLHFWSERKRKTKLTHFVASKLVATLIASQSPRRRWIKYGLITIAACLLGLSLARPQLGVELEESEARGIDIMIALDTSRSMLAEDVKPNRLERSKLAILDLLNAVQGDRVGLIAFAGEAFLQCPLTLDYDAFRATLDATDTQVIARGGTDVATAIKEASRALGGDNNFKLLVLITDGEDLEATGLAAAREAAEEGLRIFTVGVGSPTGELIPIRDARGNQDYLRDQSGTLVRSALDEESLRSIAALSNGFYSNLSGGEGLNTIYKKLVAELPPEEFGTRIQEIPLERYMWLTMIALVLLFVEPLLSTRRRKLPESKTEVLTKALLLAICFLGVGTPQEGSASPVEALSAYKKGDYEKAETLLLEAIEADPDDARLQYNLGNALYRQKKWDAAADAFQAALQTRDPEHQADAFFNLGNALYQEGRSTPDSVAGKQERLALWEQALEAYSNAESLQSADDDLTKNRQLIQGAIHVLTRALTVEVVPEEAGKAGPSGRFVKGATIELVAEAEDGWLFRRWEGAEVDNANEAKASLTLQEDSSLQAIFVKTWELTVLSADETQGTAETSGVYPVDEPVTITATSNDHYAFDYWETEGCEIEDPSVAEAQVQLTQNATVTAVFTDAFHLEVVSQPEIAGNVGQTGWYKQYSTVPLQAEARPGFEWLTWVGSDIAEPTTEQTAIALNGDRKAKALFDRVWNLVVLPNDDQGGSTMGGGNFPVGTETPISATANEGFEFVGWQGPGVADPAAAETTVVVQDGDHDVIALFTQSDSEGDGESGENEEEQEQEDSESESESSDSESSDQNDNSDSSEQNEDSESSESEDSEENEQEEQNEEEAAESEEEEQVSPEEEEANAQSEGEEAQATETETRELGEMTEEEARQLLNALRESEKKLPAVRRGENDSNTSGRDW